jgi:hypothetical protein
MMGRSRMQAAKSFAASLLVCLLAVLVSPDAVGQESPGSFGIEAAAIDEEVQVRIEEAVRKENPDWDFHVRRRGAGASVELTGRWRNELLKFDISYLMTPAEAARRLKMVNRYSSVSPVGKVKGLGEESFLFLYGSQAGVRFRQHHVVVWISCAPDFRSTAPPEISRDQREILARRVARTVETAILGFEKE